MSKHTPGPWKVYDEGSNTMYVGTISADHDAGWKHDVICSMYEDVADNYDTKNDFRLFKNAYHNANMVSAAPDLLEALQDALMLLSDNGGDEEWARIGSKYSKTGDESGATMQDVKAGVINAARNAIAKATGA